MGLPEFYKPTNRPMFVLSIWSQVFGTYENKRIREENYAVLLPNSFITSRIRFYEPFWFVLI
ncbi:MAG TPA: hypothetical protein PKC30_07170 [Saprospiraceae bacterium]|nr:hypothetical protein [Saprospiraceae bacterium]